MGGIKSYYLHNKYLVLTQVATTHSEWGRINMVSSALNNHNIISSQPSYFKIQVLNESGVEQNTLSLSMINTRYSAWDLTSRGN